MHPYVKLARQAVNEFLKNGRILKPPKDLPPEMKKRAGVFVCLKRGGQLRGCIGTFLPCNENIYLEIVRNAICAAREDPRFHPVQEDEMEDIVWTVDVLSEPEKISDVSELDAKKYGVIVAKGSQRGLLLPDIEGVNTVEEQLRIAKMKACISGDDKNVEMFRFRVERYT